MVRYHAKYLAIIIGVMVLCTLDALLTLRLLEYSGTELNPIASFFIDQGVVPFLIIKTVITFLGLTFLLVIKDVRLFGLIKSGHLIYMTLFLYVLLTLYEVHLYINNQLTFY